MIYGYEYEFGMPNGALFNSGMNGFGGIVTAILLILMLLSLAFAIVSYVLSAVGMYRIAKRRGIHHAWLAWVPVGNSWLLGSISDHYQYVVKHKNTQRRKVLLVLSLILSAVSIVFSAVVVALNLASFGAVTAATGNSAALMIVLMVFYYFAVLGLSIAATVIAYIAYYDLFRSAKPNYAVLFLVLSVIVNVTLPFFVFACSNSDRGMPERRMPKPVETLEEIPVVEAELVDDATEE